MADHKPEEPKPSDFQEAAQRSQDAGIADESAAYQNAAEKSDEEAGSNSSGGNSSGGGEGEAEAHPS